MDQIQELITDHDISAIPHNAQSDMSDITESESSGTDNSDDEFLQGTTIEYRKNTSKLKQIENYFNNQYLQALQDIDEALNYEESVEGSRYRVQNLFKNHEKLHRENPLKLDHNPRLNKHKLNIKKLHKKQLEAKEEVDSVLMVDDDVYVIDKKPKDISTFDEKIEEYNDFRNETVNSVFKISENFQQIYSQFEEELKKKRPETIRLEDQVEKMENHLNYLQRMTKEKDIFHQEALQEVEALKIQVQQVKRAYLQEYRKQEHLQKMAKRGNLLSDYIAYVNRKKKKKKLYHKQKRLQRNEQKKIHRAQLAKIQEGLEPTGQQVIINQIENIELVDSSSSDSSDSDSEDDKNIALLLAEDSAHQQIALESIQSEEEEDGEDGILTMEEVMAIDPENAVPKTKSKLDETYVRFVDGFSQKVEYYESEKAMKDRLIEEMRMQMHEQQEVESKVIQRLRQDLLAKDEEILQEKEKYRKIFIAQLTRQHTIQQEYQINISNMGAHSKKKKKLKKHVKVKNEEKKSDSSLNNKINIFDIGSLPKSPSEALRELTNQFNASGLGDKYSDILSSEPSVPDQNHEEMKKRLEKTAQKLKLRVDTAIRKKSDIQRRLNAYEVSNKPRSEDNHAVPEGRHGPKGRVVLVFTDIQGSTNLWERSIDAMVESINLHNDLIRGLLHETGGYEVKTEGDAFMCAFSSSFDAVEFAMRTQIQLLTIDWPQEVYETPFGLIEENTLGDAIWRGLRVRIGIHVGEPLIMKDPTTGRMDYFGPVVNKAARVEGCADGGEVCISKAIWEDIEDQMNPQLSKFSYLPMVRKKSFVQLKGIDGKETIRSLLPVKLKDRKFPKKKANTQSETIKLLEKKVEELESEAREAKSDISLNNMRSKIVEKEEMIQYLSTMVLLQNQNIEKLQAKAKEAAAAANDETSSTGSKQSKISRVPHSDSQYSDIERADHEKSSASLISSPNQSKYEHHSSFKKLGKNAIPKSKYREQNHKLNMMTRQRDEAVSKAEDLQRSLLKAEEKLSTLRATLHSYKKEYSIKLKHVKRETRYLRRKRRQDTHAAREEARKKTILEMEQRLPTISRNSSHRNTSPAKSSQRDRTPQRTDKKKKKSKSRLPRYMRSLKRSIKPRVHSSVNPSWVTTD